MTDDQGKTKKGAFAGRAGKAKGRLRPSFPEIQQLARTSSAVGVARHIIDPARSIFRQFADDIQLKDLFAKAEALVANADLAFTTKAVSKQPLPEQPLRGATSSGESSRKAGTKKTLSRGARLKKAAPKKTLSKSRKKRPPKRKAKRLP